MYVIVCFYHFVQNFVILVSTFALTNVDHVGPHRRLGANRRLMGIATKAICSIMTVHKFSNVRMRIMYGFGSKVRPFLLKCS